MFFSGFFLVKTDHLLKGDGDRRINGLVLNGMVLTVVNLDS